MNLYGLIGFPLTHSFSQRYFTEKFSREGISDCRYELFPLQSIESFRDTWKNNPDLRGMNVTIPYKEKVIPFLDTCNDIVLRTGACNCIKKSNGILAGFNTDVTGFEQVLIRHLQPRHKAALILGTGGAAKAVQYVLAENGIAFQSVSRKKSAGTITYAELDQGQMEEHLLIINTTPLGMYPKTDVAPDIPYHFLTPHHFLFDLIYNPAKTLFLLQGEARGAFIQNGAEMLEIQAEESWKIWNDNSNG
jgi:shikimate dehydrogenase